MINMGAFEPQRFGTIVADPAWKYGKAVQENYARGTAERQYETMTMRQIADLKVSDIAEDSSHLYLWVTNPKLFGDRSDRSISPIDIVAAWGFEYKTMLTWVKCTASGEVMRGGLGYYFRGATEHVLFATRGEAPIPTQLREPNVIIAPRSKHSRKPDEFMKLFERVSPGPRLEMFARQPREGWSAWGNEVESNVQIGSR